MMGGVNPWMILGGVAAFALVFGAGMKTGSDLANSTCNKRLLAEVRSASDVLDIKQMELEQARAQVDSINLTVAEQGRRITQLLNNDRAAREIAQEAAREREIEARRQRQVVADVLNELRVKISNEEFGTCARERVDPELISMLNDALAATD